ncbi:Hypothetical_protein [Hexamita inflata]|uniref:Hypothetical_protein n=1 Tax=Hexamita inflata TaxID=28002 RepID=A0AA86Q7D5_9EUKA|nr:Hypothetical protein HINF_LOCUS40318 [Hexamita inflata]
MYIATFDITSITHQIENADNFTNGYVFATATIIQNAFIDVSDNVYSTTVQPLFQSQRTFTNLKVQFGAQTLNSGSFILSSVQSIIINQMNIISRPGSQLTVNSNSQLNILTDSPTRAVINNLLMNLSFSSSSGNITLINNIIGILNISGYQIIGDYNSTSTVAMIGLNVKMATINVNQVRFQPSTFNVGNGSSYLFGSSIKLQSIFMINNFAVKIGSSYNFLLLGSISTNDQSNYYYQFGGIIALVLISSSISVNNVILDSYQKFSSEYVSYSGFLIGYLGYIESSIQSNITIQNVCLQQNMTSSTSQFMNFGLIGHNHGKIQIQNALVAFSVQGDQFQIIGIIGINFDAYAEVLNLKTSVSFSFRHGISVGSVFGHQGSNCTVQNTQIIDGYIKSAENVGGIFGCSADNVTVLNSSIINMDVSKTNITGSYNGGIIGCQYSNTTILDSQITNINIQGFNSLGGVIGTCLFNLYLQNIQIKYVRIYRGFNTYNFGIVVGENFNIDGIYSFTNSIARQNFIDDVQQTECTILKTNSWSVTGC